MKTIAQVLPHDALDAVLERVAPADVDRKELQEFKAYLAGLGQRQLRELAADLQGGARSRARRIMLREQLLERLGTQWLRRHREMVEAQLAQVELARDITEVNIYELELASRSWRMDRDLDVAQLSDRVRNDPLIALIKRQQREGELETLGPPNHLDDARLRLLFEVG